METLPLGSQSFPLSLNCGEKKRRRNKTLFTKKKRDRHHRQLMYLHLNCLHLLFLLYPHCLYYYMLLCLFIFAILFLYVMLVWNDILILCPIHIAVLTIKLTWLEKHRSELQLSVKLSWTLRFETENVLKLTNVTHKTKWTTLIKWSM